jgi:hypothetical protein
MTLGSTERSVVGYRVLRRVAPAVLALVLTLALPVAGGWWAGLPGWVWTEFPPRQAYVRHAAFSWPVFALLAALVAAAVGTVARRVLRSRDAIAPADAPLRSVPRRCPRFPGWGWAAAAWTVAAWFVAWTRLPALAPLQSLTYPPIWFGAIVVVRALELRATGACRLARTPGAFAGLFVASAAFWWGFEFLNRAVQNWFYQNVETFTPSIYAIMATLSFTTVLPAVLGVHDWLCASPRLTAGLEDWVRLRPCRPRLVGAAAAVAGGLGLFLLPAWPSVLFPLLWLAPLGLICGLPAAAGQRTLFDDLGRGDWRTVVRLSLAALICGFFWEMWNMYSLARWVYDVPYVGRFRVFEMPVLGFAGYLPFGWECAAVAMAFGLWQPPAPQGVTGAEGRLRLVDGCERERPQRRRNSLANREKLGFQACPPVVDTENP